MASPLDLSKFKKVRVEKLHTILRHPDGHEIKVLHNALSPKIKQQLDAVHMSEGGQVGEDAALKENYKTEGFKQAQSRGKSIVHKQIHKYSQGGLANNEKLQAAYQGDKESSEQKVEQKPSPAPINQAAQSAQQSMRKAFHYDGGGPVIDPNKAQSAQDSMRKAFHFDEGGNVPQPNSTPANDDPTHAMLSEALLNLTQKHAITQDQAPQEDKAAPVGSSVPQAPDSSAVASPEAATPQVPSAPQGTLPQQSIADTEQENQAAMQIGANTQQAETSKSQAYQNQSEGLQADRAKFEELGNQYHKAYDETAKQVAEGHVDPNHWWSSKSTGSKVLTAIGMLFAGAGGGVAGHPEMASNLINKFIDNDIEAQKADLNNKNTLLGKYVEMYNSLPQAENATRLALGAATEGLVNQAASKLGSQNAIAAAQQWVAHNRQEQLKNLTGLAQGQLTLNALGEMDKPSQAQHGAIDMNKWQNLKMAGLMKEDEAAATKEAQNYQEAQVLKEDMEQSAKHLEKQLLHGAFSPNDTNSAKQAFAGRIAKIGEGRFNLQEAQLQSDALLPQKLDSKSTLRNKAQRREAFFKSLAQTPTLQRLGILNPAQSSIRVKLKSTGQTGTIPANEFDPKIYSKED